MRLNSIHIHHFKSLDNTGIEDLSSLTLLVGANGVGKSNLIDALRFLRDMVVEGLDHAISKRSGIATIRQHSPKKPYDVIVKFTFTQTFDDEPDRKGSYEITIESLSGGNYQIKRESAVWFDHEYEYDEVSDQHIDLGTSETKLTRDAEGTLTINGKKSKMRLPIDQPALGARSSYGRMAAPITDFVSRFRFTSIFPNTLREPSRPDTDKLLKESGENWASIIKASKKTAAGKHSLDRVREMMQVVMPTLQDVSVRTAGAYLVPQFRVKDTDKSAAHDFDPVQISDGTLRVFGILLALYQNPPPPFIALEEPEQTVHPAVLSMLSEAFREVSERTQLLITSHSPYLVDFFSAEEIQIVSMQSGKTRISPIKLSQKESVKENLISLQELMMAEGLLPELQ
jgi:predicted ATPase